MDDTDKRFSVSASAPTACLTFPQAMRAIKDGKRITKREWDSRDFWCELHPAQGLLMIRKPDGLYYAWTISDGDIMGDDWYVLE